MEVDKKKMEGWLEDCKKLKKQFQDNIKGCEKAIALYNGKIEVLESILEE